MLIHILCITTITFIVISVKVELLFAQTSRWSLHSFLPSLDHCRATSCPSLGVLKVSNCHRHVWPTAIFWTIVEISNFKHAAILSQYVLCEGPIIPYIYPCGSGTYYCKTDFHLVIYKLTTHPVHFIDATNNFIFIIHLWF